jgi:CheY-like chemotaxis protein
MAEKTRILAIEGDERFRLILTKRLETAGYIVTDKTNDTEQKEKGAIHAIAGPANIVGGEERMEEFLWECRTR